MLLRLIGRLPSSVGAFCTFKFLPCLEPRLVGAITLVAQCLQLALVLRDVRVKLLPTELRCRGGQRFEGFLAGLGDLPLAGRDLAPQVSSSSGAALGPAAA